MMNNKLDVHFTSVRFTTPTDSWKETGRAKVKGRVICSIFNQFTGVSECSSKDDWDENKGRKLAFQRALVPFMGEIKRMIWKEVFDRGLLYKR